MSRIITRMTRGRIRTGTTKKVLVLAVFGALYFTEVNAPTQTLKRVQGFGGAGTELKKRREIDFFDRRIQEEEELMLIIKIFIRCQN